MILKFRQFRDFSDARDSEQQNYFVVIDGSEIKDITMKKAGEWLYFLGDSLKTNANKDLKSIIRETNDYGNALEGEMGAIEQLKALLNVISEIKNKSMDMEFRIVEVQEQFRVLNMHEYEIESDTQKDVENLMANWQALLELAEKRDFEVNDFKKNFAEVTKQDVDNFKESIQKEYA